MWDLMFSMFLEFKQNYDHYNVPYKWPENIKLSRWVDRLSKLWADGKLLPERVNKLVEIGFVVIAHKEIKDQKWEHMYSMLCEFKKDHGHCKVPNGWPQNPQLAIWVSNQRQMKRKGHLPVDCLKKLDEIDFVWHTRENLWEQNFRELLKYRDIHGHCIIPHDWPENPKLGLWVNNQRRNKKIGKLSADRMHRLDEIGFTWAVVDSAWDNNYLKLLHYYKTNGHTNVPAKCAADLQLGKWVAHQRVRYKRGYLSKDQIQLLNSVKFNWSPKDTWNEMFSKLVEFTNSYGHPNVLRDWPGNPELSHWVNRQRRLYKTGRLNSEKINRLDKIGFQWDVLENVWEQRFSELLSFKERFGHCNVPDKWQENPKLGNWIGVQRRSYQKGKISQERISGLNEVGFLWSPIDASWEQMFSELLQFKESNGHCDVPKRFEDNLKLGLWAARQRAAIRKGQLNGERLRWLTEIGFDEIGEARPKSE